MKVWTDHIATEVENQDQMWLPMNDISKLMYYDQRIVVSSQAMEKPITWKVSKVENIHPFGINKLTLSQCKFDPNTDKKIDGWWYADYAKSMVEPNPEPFVEEHEDAYGKISWNGTSPIIKVGGQAKKFTAEFYTADGVLIEDSPVWSFTVNNEDVSDKLQIRYEEASCFVSTDDSSLVNKILYIRVTQEERGLEAEVHVEIVNL